MLSEPLLLSAKLAAPPNDVLREFTMSPMVMPAVSVTLACLPTSPLGPLSVNDIVPPAANPPASLDDKPVERIDGAPVENRSLRPKNCEKPTPPREDGVVASSCT